MIEVTTLAVVLAAAIAVFAAKQRRVLMALLVGVTGGLFAVQVLQMHVFTFAVLAWALSSRRAGSRLLPWQAIVVLACSIPLALTALTGDLVNSPSLALQLLALATCSVIVVVNASRDDVSQMLMGLLSISSFGCTWALLQVAGIVPNDAWHLSVSALGRPTGIYPEPDWLGMYAGVGVVLAWRLGITPRWRVLLVSINAFALVLAFARSPWIAVVASSVAALFVAWIHGKRTKSGIRFRTHTGRLPSVVLLAVAGTAALIMLPSLRSDLTVRLSRTLVAASDDVSAQARVQQNESLAYLAQTAPWFGHGISSSGRVGVSGRINYGESPNNLGSNWIVSMWVDGAFLSLPLILLLVGATILAARHVQAHLLLLVLLSSIFSNAIFQPITWLLLALCLVELRIKREEGLALKKDKPTRASFSRAQVPSPS